MAEALRHRPPERIIRLTPDGRYLLDNASHQQFLGMQRPDEVFGKTVFDLFPQELAKGFDAHNVELSAVARDKAGTSSVASITTAPLTDSAAFISAMPSSVIRRVVGLSGAIAVRRNSRDSPSRCG